AGGFWGTGFAAGTKRVQLFLHWRSGRWTTTRVPNGTHEPGNVDELALIGGTRSLWPPATSSAPATAPPSTAAPSGGTPPDWPARPRSGARHRQAVPGAAAVGGAPQRRARDPAGLAGHEVHHRGRRVVVGVVDAKGHVASDGAPGPAGVVGGQDVVAVHQPPVRPADRVHDPALGRAGRGDRPPRHAAVGADVDH